MPGTGNAVAAPGVSEVVPLFYCNPSCSKCRSVVSLHDAHRRVRRRGVGLADRSGDDLLEAVTTHPILLERPILVAGDRTVIGRPPGRVLDLL